MRIRIEVDWDELVNLVGHSKAKGLCRKTRAQIIHEDAPNLIPPWEKEYRHPRYGRWT